MQRKEVLSDSFIEERKKQILKRVGYLDNEDVLVNKVDGNQSYQAISYRPKDFKSVLLTVIKIIETDKESYGVCRSCGADIEKNRLILSPAALDCQRCMR